MNRFTLALARPLFFALGLSALSAARASSARADDAGVDASADGSADGGGGDASVDASDAVDAGDAADASDTTSSGASSNGNIDPGAVGQAGLPSRPPTVGGGSCQAGASRRGFGLAGVWFALAAMACLARRRQRAARTCVHAPGTHESRAS